MNWDDPELDKYFERREMRFINDYTVTIDKTNTPDLSVHMAYAVEPEPPRRKSAEDVISENPLALKYWNRGDKRAALFVVGIK